jgi:isopenicillin-N N-acyltransferase-like protein
MSTDAVTGGPRTFPYIRAEGSPHERGRQYGAHASERIARNVRHYRDAFEQKYAISWDDAMRRADALLPVLEDYDPDSVLEMAGIASGSDQPIEAIVTLNSRTEIVHSGYVAECTTAAVLPRRSHKGHTLLAQNWDWLRGAAQTSVLLHVVTEHGLEYVSLHEAGGLVRSGFNSAGLGCVGNFVASAEQPGRVGIPLPIIGRKILSSRTISEAMELAVAGPRSIGVNYLMASASGGAVDIETTADQAFVIEPADGLLLHTNHYLTAGVCDLGLPKMPDSAVRLDRARALLDAKPTLGPEDLFAALADHHNHPRSICKHPSSESPFADVTLASTVMDLDDGVLWLTQGNPCEFEYERWNLFAAGTVGAAEGSQSAVSG